MLKLNEKSAKSTYIILALSIIMLVIVGIRLYSDTYAAFMQKDIASQIIRFHIRANDDSEEAQNNKMLVGAFPKLAAGDNNISWAGNVTKIEIVPRWCKL